MGRYILIGDVHGCREELDRLLDRLDLRYDDRLHFVGDLVNKGPDSLGVLRRVAALIACHPRSVCLAGNHEEKAIRYREQGRPLSGWAAEANEDDWRFLESLPLIHRIPELNVILVHGGFYPAWFEMHGSLGEVPMAWRYDRGRRAQGMRRFLRVRRVDERGRPIPARHARWEDPHWSELYDGREGFCYFGHDPQIKPPTPLLAKHAIGLDTGACYGGRLTAAVLTEGGSARHPRFVSVSCKPYAVWRGHVLGGTKGSRPNPREAAPSEQPASNAAPQAAPPVEPERPEEADPLDSTELTTIDDED